MRISAVALFFMMILSTFAQDVKSYRILFLGNSVFFVHGGIYQSFLGFCQSEGFNCQVISQREQPENTHGVEFLGFGRIPNTLPEVASDKRIHTMILEGKFDYVILEARREGYLLPDWVERPAELKAGDYIPYQQNLDALRDLHRTIVKSGAKTVLYMHPGLRDAPDWRNPVAQTYEKIRIDMVRTEIKGAHHSVLLVPASLLWADAINRFGIDAMYIDRIHGTAIARYVSGCMIFTYLTGKDPRENNFRELPRTWETSPDEKAVYVSKEDAEWIKRQVWLYYTTRSQQ